MILLDTVAFIDLAVGDSVSDAARAAIVDAERQRGLFISAISLWEIDTLARRTGRTGQMLGRNARRWTSFAFTQIPAIVIAFEAEDALALTELPAMHADPADRMLVATARRRGIPLLTNDRKILALAGQGHVEAIAC